MTNEANLLFADPDEELEEDEPEIIEYRANFSRTVYLTESTSVTFEAEAGLSKQELDRLAWEEFNWERYHDWYSHDDYDSGDTELDDIEEN